MKELPERIHDDTNGLDYVLVGDYYIPALRLTEESRPIGHWGRRRKAYLEEARPAFYCSLLLSGKLWTHLADVDEQAQERFDLIMEQMKAAEGVTEKLKADDQLEWVRRCNSIRNRAEEIIYAELVYA
ncbi:TnpV protein [Lachnospiraceae bacterium 29-91]